MLHTLLPSDILDEIINLKLHFNSNTEYTFIWHENSNGIYTTKTGFSWILKQRGGDVTSISWAWIWRLHLLKKIKFLVWLAHSNYVPTLSILNHRNLAPNALCPCCSSSEEAFLYCIRDCITSTHLWHALGSTSVEFFSNTDTLCWLKQGLTSQSSNIFASGVWWSWRNQNSTCFSNILSLPTVLPWKLVTYLSP